MCKCTYNVHVCTCMSIIEAMELLYVAYQPDKVIKKDRKESHAHLYYIYAYVCNVCTFVRSYEC